MELRANVSMGRYIQTRVWFRQRLPCLYDSRGAWLYRTEWIEWNIPTDRPVQKIILRMNQRPPRHKMSGMFRRYDFYVPGLAFRVHHPLQSIPIFPVHCKTRQLQSR